MSVLITKPSNHFNVILDTGANIKSACEAVYGDGLYVIKDRANSNNWQWIDYVRGTSNVLHSNDTNAETTYSAPSGNSVGFCWKAGGTPTTDNVAGAGNVPTAGSVKIDGVDMSSALAGTIAATRLSANTVAGFSIVTYSGNSTSGATVAHGLGTTPALIIIKKRNAAVHDWNVWHKSFGATDNIYLNGTGAKFTDSAFFNGASTSTTVCLGSSAGVNGANTYLMLAFAEIPGYSKFGSYVGNGSADGPFVWCGFRPKYVLIKAASGGTGNWVVEDASRSTYNVTAAALYPDLSNAEDTGNPLDITANGFKHRGTATSSNANGVTYIFAAFAEHPFGGSNVAPSPAR